METLDFDYKKSFKTLKSNEKRVCKLFFAKNICIMGTIRSTK